MTNVLVITIREKAGNAIQSFEAECLPHTLRVVRHPSKASFTIRVTGTDQQDRVWAAHELLELKYKRRHVGKDGK